MSGRLTQPAPINNEHGVPIAEVLRAERAAAKRLELAYRAALLAWVKTTTCSAQKKRRMVENAMLMSEKVLS